jgi:hypothetical protein
VSLRRDSDSRSSNIADSNELQLFDLPPIRRTVGVLRGERREDRRAEECSLEVLMEPEDPRLLPMQKLRLRHALRVSEEAS